MQRFLRLPKILQKRLFGQKEMQAIGFELSKQFKIENLVTLYLNISVKVNLRVKAIINFLGVIFLEI